VAQRDPIQTAKLVASIDQISSGRFLFGVGGGWNAEVLPVLDRWAGLINRAQQQ
jgi:alkanesulfonate monooxygenase SsuD/methylene tetrahydromethanopterin reductase-like flavin-dependent oxidoreductase (luciferase family)